MKITDWLYEGLSEEEIIIVSRELNIRQEPRKEHDYDFWKDMHKDIWRND